MEDIAHDRVRCEPQRIANSASVPLKMDEDGKVRVDTARVEDAIAGVIRDIEKYAEYEEYVFVQAEPRFSVEIRLERIALRRPESVPMEQFRGMAESTDGSRPIVVDVRAEPPLRLE